jgi:hypothetical protein
MQEQNDNISNIKSDISTLNSKLENELINTIKLFINEIELVFEYVKNIKSIKKYTDSLVENKENLQKFIKECLENLKEHEEKIYFIHADKKIKSSDFEFLNNVTLFNNLLNFKVFNDENKNTKKTIVKYIYTIYMSSFILNFGLQSDNQSDELLSFVSSLQNKLNIKTNDKNVDKNNKSSKNTLPKIDNMNMDIQNLGLPNLGLSNLNGITNIFQSLMSNNEIMNIATDLSKDIKNENIDPMSLLSSIMSGQPNDKLNKLVSNITNKIETKINNGEIDKNLLEEQAQNIMNSVQNNNLFDKL